MLEQLETPDILSEANIIAETQKELSSLKKDIFDTKVEKENERIETKREGFGDYLQENGIDTNEFPKASGLGKFLRTFRYYKEIRDVTTEKNIPLNYFFGLKMIEGEGDPSTINTLDGGAGISQIQPDTFKQFGKDNLGKNYKVFSDDPKYSNFSYEKLTKEQGKTRKEANKIIANKLMAIKKDGGYPALIALDDRFNPDIALEFSAEYLLHCKTYVTTKGFTDKSWDVYKNDPKFDFEWMLAFNGYNKGPASFDVDVTGNHLTNLKTRIEQYDLYSQKLTDLLKKGYTYEEILLNIKKEEKDWKKIEKKEEKVEKESQFLARGKATVSPKKLGEKDPTNKETKDLKYLNKSKDKEWFVYKYTISSDITSVIDLTKIYSAFAGTTFQITDADGNELKRPNIPSKKGEYFYIKEKIV